MTYKRIKWLILFIPTLTIGLWEYIRHQFLLPYISMDLGNWLTPLIVCLVSLTLLKRMFHMLERIQRELEIERSATAALEAREQLSKELHDGIAQSLFLLSVRVDKLEGGLDNKQHMEQIYQIRKTVREVNHYVRQAIADLKYEPPRVEAPPELEAMESILDKMAANVPLDIAVEWTIPDEMLLPKERVELLACIREAVVNMEKHAAASAGWITGRGEAGGWNVIIKDNGKGFEGNAFSHKGRYGLNIMKERAEAMGWTMKFYRDSPYTIVWLANQGGRT